MYRAVGCSVFAFRDTQQISQNWRNQWSTAIRFVDGPLRRRAGTKEVGINLSTGLPHRCHAETG